MVIYLHDNCWVRTARKITISHITLVKDLYHLFVAFFFFFLNQLWRSLAPFCSCSYFWYRMDPDWSSYYLNSDWYNLFSAHVFNYIISRYPLWHKGELFRRLSQYVSNYSLRFGWNFTNKFGKFNITNGFASQRTH